MLKKYYYLFFILLLITAPAISQTTNTNNFIKSEQAKIIYIDSTITNLSKQELQKICEKLNISSDGSKKNLITRLSAFLKQSSKENNNTKTSNKKETLQDVIIIERADGGEYLKIDENNQEILTAFGNVQLAYNKIRIKTEKIKLNVQTKDMMCEGNVILFDGSKEITGEKIFYNLNTEYGVIYKGKSKIGEIIYTGEKIKKGENDLYIIDKAQFTSCNEEPPHYYIEARKVWVYPNNKIVLLDAYYVIAGVKTCWLPLYFRFQKGTAIITSWGKRSTEGWYIQNTYRYKISQNDRGDIKFDHYQKRGEYLGIDYYNKSNDSEIIASAGGAYDKKLFNNNSNINPATGEIERDYRGKVSIKGRYTFNRDKENKNNNTSIWVNVFKMSDYSFIQDFELYRETKPGIHYNDKPIIYNDLYNQQENDWYININDTRDNSSLNINTKWHYQWNQINKEWVLTEKQFPSISYQFNGTLWAPPKQTEKTNQKRGISLYPNLNYNISLGFSHIDYYDYTTGDYSKSLNSRQAQVNLSKTFGISKIFQYIPSIGIGDKAYWPYNVTEAEKYNYEKDTYSYGNFSDILQIGPSSLYFRAAHNLQWRFTNPPPEDEYGKITAHSISFSHNNSFITGLTFSANTSYDLRVKKNESLNGIEKDRFSDLYTSLRVSMIKNITLNEGYTYSIRNSQPLTSNLSLNYSLSSFSLPFIQTNNSFSANIIWNHNFPNPRASILNIDFNLNLKISKVWNVNISSHSVNEKLYLYSETLAKKYEVEVTEKNVGEYEHRNFFVDLLNSINFFEPSKRKASYFKLRNASINVTHDLHCWQMSFGYTLQQRYFNYGISTQYPYYEHSFWLKINMKFESKLGIDEQIRTEPPNGVRE